MRPVPGVFPGAETLEQLHNNITESIPLARLSLDTILSRAAALRCPRCGKGPLYRSFFRMHDTCDICGLKYERAPGYFLGSIYINYGITAMTMSFSYIFFHIVLGYENRAVLPPVIAFCLLFPVVFVRYARSYWLALDCYFDPEGFELNSPTDGEPPQDA